MENAYLTGPALEVSGQGMLVQILEYKSLQLTASDMASRIARKCTDISSGCYSMTDFLLSRIQSYMESASSSTPTADADPVVKDTMTLSEVNIPLVCARKNGVTAEWQAASELTDSEGVQYLPLKIKGDTADWRFCHCTNEDWASVKESGYGPEALGPRDGD